MIAIAIRQKNNIRDVIYVSPVKTRLKSDCRNS